MSLFSEFSSQSIIENPKQLGQYHKILKKHKEKEEVKTWKEIRNEKKAQLSKEEYRHWLTNQYYPRNKEKVKERYQQNKKEMEAYMEEIYKDVYDQLVFNPDYDKIFKDKFFEDDTDWEWRYRFSWRASHLALLRFDKIRSIDFPIRIIENYNFDNLIRNQTRIQTQAYEYLKPHINEIDIRDFFMAKKQKMTNRPLRECYWKMLELVMATKIPHNQLCSIASAIIRWRYIASEVYLWRYSFLVWDVIVTTMGQMFRPCLENNLWWLTKDTVDMLHTARLEFMKYTRWINVPIAIIKDAYLIAIKTNERETLYYVVPTARWWYKMNKKWDIDTALEKNLLIFRKKE